MLDAVARLSIAGIISDVLPQVMGDMAIQSQEKQVENEELSTDAAVNKAELDKRVADGDAKLKTEAKEQEKEKEPVDETQLAPVMQLTRSLSQ